MASGSDLVAIAYDAATGARRWAARYDGPGHGDEVGGVSFLSGSTSWSPGNAHPCWREELDDGRLQLQHRRPALERSL
jgi:hypothetical protein